MLVMMATEDCLKEVPSWTLPKGSTWHTAQFTDYGFVLYQLCQIWHTIVPDAGIIQVWHGNLL